MKLRRARITNYKSIVESGIVEIEDGVTVVIGKNEQGKTTFLKSLASFNRDWSYRPGDLPNHLRRQLEKEPPETLEIVSLWFNLEPQDLTELHNLINDIDQIQELKCVRYFDNHYTYSLIRGQEEQPITFVPLDVSKEASQLKEVAKALVTKFNAHANRFPQFAASKEQYSQIINTLLNASLTSSQHITDSGETFITALKSLPAQDAAIQQDIASASSQVTNIVASAASIAKQDQGEIFQSKLPIFLFHSTKSDAIPNEVPVTEFLEAPEKISRGMLHLCRAAGLTMEELKKLASSVDSSERHSYEDYYTKSLSGAINEYWKQESYKIYFQIENGKLNISISDSTYDQRIFPSERSEGFQWYLSFYTTVLNEIGPNNKFILLLDNPGLELHIDGQRDIKNFLENRIAFNSQVIYVTHSPSMIDPFNLGQLRRVTLMGEEQGTKIDARLIKEGNDFDLLEPVRAAIGMSLAGSLIVSDYTVLVEGASDKPILDAAFGVWPPADGRKVLINGSMSESKDGILARFYARTQLPYIVLLDADSAGRSIKGILISKGIPEDRILMLNDIFTDRQNDFAIEDLVSWDFYSKAVKKEYADWTEEISNDSGTQKRVEIYEKAFKTRKGIGFSKKRVAETIGRMLYNNEHDDETKDNLHKLLQEIKKRFGSSTAGERS